nr:MAG TPA: hypothetical protein [Caudoviricetes sp.]
MQQLFFYPKTRVNARNAVKMETMKFVILLTYVISQISEKALDLFRMIILGKGARG